MLRLNPNRDPMKSFEHYFLPAKLSDFVDLSALRSVTMGTMYKIDLNMAQDEIFLITYVPAVRETYGLKEYHYHLVKMRPEFIEWCNAVIGVVDGWQPSSIEIGENHDGVFLASVSSENCIAHRKLCELIPEETKQCSKCNQTIG